MPINHFFLSTIDKPAGKIIVLCLHLFRELAGYETTNG